MKKAIYTLVSSVVLLLAIAVIQSCSNAAYDCGCDPTEENITLDLSFTKSGTRDIATEPSDHDGEFNEAVINSLDIFFYQGSTLKWHVKSPAGLSYDQATKKATMPVPADKRALFLNNTTVSYDVYVVANNTADLASIAEGADNLSQLKNIVFQTVDFANKGGQEKQTSFVMDGKITKTVNLNSPELGVVDLKRAASKIRLRLVQVAVPGYTQNGTPQARLVHFTDKSVLIDGGIMPVPTEWKNTQARNLSADAPANVGGGKTTAAPFYAYTNDWKSVGDRETYIELLVPLKETATGTENFYKYRVPVTPQNLTGDDAQYMNRLDRNFLYDIAVTVKILGSIEEPPVEVTGNYIIKNWSTQEVLVDVKAAHYLVVSQRNVTMPNIITYKLTFNSSIANVTLVPGSLKATYTYVPAGGAAPVTLPVASTQNPTVYVKPNVASDTITISSPIPVNYIPKDIEFKITNGPLTETVTVRQYAGTYFTTTEGVQSAHYDNLQEMNDNVAGDPNNPYMYAITSTSSGGKFKDGVTPIVWGFPPVDTNGYTIDSQDVSRMVSPKFEMASQFGASQRKGYAAAQTQCKNYWEKAADGTTKRGWRLPTAAEIRYIDELQNDSNNPQGIVMAGRYYWDSYSADGAYMMIGGSGGSFSEAYVRCIRDIKE